MNVALVCIAKNEDLYIEEWINYHFKIGFDQIFIYQNDWRFDKEIPNVTKIEFDGIKRQMQSYDDFILKYGKDFDWVAFFDVDEFLVLKKHIGVKDFIKDYSDYDAIGISWVLFGDNNITEVTDNYSVIERFTKRESTVNRHIKSIIRPSVVKEMSSPHNPNWVWVDTSFKVNTGSQNENPTDDVAQLNHYFVKTKVEFISKINRGRADTAQFRNLRDFDSHNKNEVDDYNALNFWKK